MPPFGPQNPQGAAEAALFALYLDAAGRYDVTAYTYGQPKIGRGHAWRAAYDGPNGLSKRTFRVVSALACAVCAPCCCLCATTCA